MIPSDCVTLLCSIAMALGIYASEVPQKIKDINTKERRPLYGIGEHIYTATPDCTTLLACQFKPDIIATKTYTNTTRGPNYSKTIAYLNHKRQLKYDDITKRLFVATEYLPSDRNHINIANAVGMPSPGLETIEQNIVQTLKLLQEHQPTTKLMVSVYSTSLEGFATMAKLTKKLQVPYVCANLSCPNIENGAGCLYKDPIRVAAVLATMIPILTSTPLIVKVGLFASEELFLMEEVCKTIAQKGAYAIYGINAPRARIVNEDGSPTFGQDREYAGLSGTQIRSLTLDWAKKTRAIIDTYELPLKLFVGGGITRQEDFALFESCKPDALFSVTGIMFNTLTFPEQHPKSFTSLAKEFGSLNKKARMGNYLNTLVSKL
ncbi:MAG TPA: hypothetical protein VGW78_04110 [Candidatus Babeliales bacterium]|nr:hypothetical protein [Candidatus Babeliales bacterium]